MIGNVEHELMLMFADDTFKNFYQKHTKEKKYLFSKIDANDLVEFSKTRFKLKEVLHCVYVQEYINKKGITKQEFKKNVLAYIKKNNKKCLKCDEESIKKDKENIESYTNSIRYYSVEYIEETVSQNTPEDEKKELVAFESVRPDKYKQLKKVLNYIFEKENTMLYFKEGKPYNFNAIEAMFMVYILDDMNKDDVEHISTVEGRLISRRFMNVLKNYAYEIVKIRAIEYDDEERSITDIYKERFKELKSDLSVIIKMLNDADIEFKKDGDADYDKIIETSNKCIKKLDKFAFRCSLIKLENDD